ncbi:MAG: hypothetical protein R3185_03530, partial [Candidatus Thermoplasmatota archaeon]|nr:hypothetical protein [Candidatus Thermoplasmatota archaeon]
MMSIEQRLRDLQDARDDPRESLATVNSAESVRNNAGQGLAQLPYLTINDILHLRAQGYQSLDDLEERLLEVPEPAWGHVIELVRSEVLIVDPSKLTVPDDHEDGQPRCLAYTKSGERCRNKSRSSSKYCSSHKGYQPS